MQEYEQLGSFYLGKTFDPAAGKVGQDLVLYDAKDLTTHAVIVGMTGSGKTGLAVTLIEEAAIDGVPTLAIDPKGDLGNLLLTFPALSAGDFRPWVDEAEAAGKGKTPDAYAAEVAERWKTGLASWGQDGARIERLRAAADAVLYTPGSTAGVPLSILRSFEAPPQQVRDDQEALRERVVATASSVLALLGIEADPVRSKEHILLANLLDGAWREGRTVDLPALIRAVQKPPFERLGVFELEAFYPAKERAELAMALNGLVAAPAFAAWNEGEPLDVQRLLWTPEGKPRIAVVSIAHLNDQERMFFVTTLLTQVLAWMRQQSGTGSLRALLYMDEVFGYFPPTANPPSKLPMLTLLKQARAFGLGIVLATQNPVDLDYKGLGNAGTWFLGRLQTERDKQRIADGLEGASASAKGLDRARLLATLSALQGRVFLMVNAHDDQPTLFQTRWTLSYLRGPLTKPQIQALARRPETPAAALPYGARGPAASPPPVPGLAAERAAAGGARPVLAAGVAEWFLPVTKPLANARLEYRPQLLGTARVHYVDAKAGVDVYETLVVRALVPEEAQLDPWAGADAQSGSTPSLEREPLTGATFAPLPAAAGRAKSYEGWQKAFAEWLYRERVLTLHSCAAPKLAGRAGEDEGAFRVRVAQALREQRDAAVEALRQKYAPKLQALQDRVRAAEGRVAAERSQATGSKISAAISFGTSLLGALFGSKKALSSANIGRAATAARSITRTAKESGDVARAEEGVDVLRQRLADLEAELQKEVEALKAGVEPGALPITSVVIRPKKTDTTVGVVALAWAPWRVVMDGVAEPAG